MSNESLEASVQRLVASPGGQVLLALQVGIRRYAKYYLAIFTLGFVIAFPLTSTVISWFIDAKRLPADVNIIVISPVEFLFLQLRIASSFSVLLMSICMVVHVSVYGLRHQAVQSRLKELDITLPKPGINLLITILSALVLVCLGLLYGWYGLIPMLLDYLTNDAQQAGLTTEWRLSGYAGFVSNLLIASALGFQAPLLTMLVLGSGIFTREQIVQSRRAIWFASCVMGALLSPPDPLSLFLVAIPVIVLFELAMAIDLILRRKKQDAQRSQ